ncbi:basic secretory protein-like protein [Patescibacteria group bacterium]
MKNKSKTCIFIFFTILIVFACSATSLGSGIIIGRNDKEEETSSPATITEKIVYYEQTTSQRYFDENSDLDTFNKLLTDAQSHFTFQFNVSDENIFDEDKDFLLANLENQYSRLSVKFNKNITEKITIKFVDDLDVFSEDLGTTFSEISGYSAFSLGGDFIEIYVNPLYTSDKFQIAHTVSHELVHIFQYQVNDSITMYDARWASVNWFIEGMAEGFSYPNEDSLIHSEVYKTIPDIESLNSLISSRIPQDYMIGYDAVELLFVYLSETYGEEKMIQLVKTRANFDDNFNNAIGKSIDEVYNDWLEQL